MMPSGAVAGAGCWRMTCTTCRTAPGALLLTLHWLLISSHHYCCMCLPPGRLHAPARLRTLSANTLSLRFVAPSPRMPLAAQQLGTTSGSSSSQLYVGPPGLGRFHSSKLHFIKGVCNGRALSAADVPELQLQLGEWAKPSWQVGGSYRPSAGAAGPCAALALHMRPSTGGSCK
jgi:hypothetical protein